MIVLWLMYRSLKHENSSREGNTCHFPDKKIQNITLKHQQATEMRILLDILKLNKRIAVAPSNYLQIKSEIIKHKITK